MPFRFTPSLKALRSFEAAARLGSLSRAAEELNVSVSAVAFQVRQVEEGLGRPMLRRSGRALALTGEGRRLAEALGRAFAGVDAAVDAFREPAATGLVIVGMLGSFASLWLLPRLDPFRAEHPGVELRIVASTAHADFAKGEADCAIRCGPGGWPGVTTVPLFPQRLAPVCAADHPAARSDVAGTIPPDRDLVVNAARPGEWAEWFAATGSPRPEPVGGQRVDGRELAADAVRAGLGVGLLDVSVLARDLAGSALVQLGSGVGTGWTYWLVKPIDRAISPAVAAFERWLLAQAAAEVGGSDATRTATLR